MAVSNVATVVDNLHGPWQQSDTSHVQTVRAAAEAAKADPMPILRALAAELSRGPTAESPLASPLPATAATAFLGCKATVVRLPTPRAPSPHSGSVAAGSSGSRDDGATATTPRQPAVDIPSAAADDALAACTANRLGMQVSGHRRAATTDRQPHIFDAPPLLLLTLCTIQFRLLTCACRSV
jgi:hypothetical protein